MHNVHMMERHERLQWARKQAGYGYATEAAEDKDWPVSTYLAHENSSRGITVAAGRKYAIGFGVRVEWLLYGTGSPKPNQKHPLLELYDEMPAQLQEHAINYLKFLKNQREE